MFSTIGGVVNKIAAMAAAGGRDSGEGVSFCRVHVVCLGLVLAVEEIVEMIYVAGFGKDG